MQNFSYTQSDYFYFMVKQCQAKLRWYTKIPDWIFDHAKKEIPRSEMTPERIYDFLKKKHPSFADKSNFIFQKLTGENVPMLTEQQEKYLVFMFGKLRPHIQLQSPYHLYVKILCKHANFNLTCPPISSKYDYRCTEIEERLQGVLAESATKIQSCWRRYHAKKLLLRMRIKQELEYLPRVGIKYLEGLHHFNTNKS